MGYECLVQSQLDWISIGKCHYIRRALHTLALRWQKSSTRFRGKLSGRAALPSFLPSTVLEAIIQSASLLQLPSYTTAAAQSASTCRYILHTHSINVLFEMILSDANALETKLCFLDNGLSNQGPCSTHVVLERRGLTRALNEFVVRRRCPRRRGAYPPAAAGEQVQEKGDRGRQEEEQEPLQSRPSSNAASLGRFSIGLICTYGKLCFSLVKCSRR